MADKLQIYNLTLGHLDQRKLASLSENSESLRVLDDYWDQEVAYCLERKFWNFIYRTVSIDASSTTVPGFGFQYAFRIPDDWIRTRTASSAAGLDPPFKDKEIAEETGYWYANVTPIFVQYNSRDPLYGLNIGEWPASFVDYVSKRLARQSCKRITGSHELLPGPEGLIKQEEKAYKIAGSICAMNEAVGFAPQSSWILARRGFGNLPAPGDNPTGGSLIP